MYSVLLGRPVNEVEVDVVQAEPGQAGLQASQEDWKPCSAVASLS